MVIKFHFTAFVAIKSTFLILVYCKVLTTD